MSKLCIWWHANLPLFAKINVAWNERRHPTQSWTAAVVVNVNSANTCFEAVCPINKTIEERAGGPASDVMSLSDNWIHAPCDNTLQLSYFRAEDTSWHVVVISSGGYCVVGVRDVTVALWNVYCTTVRCRKLSGSNLGPETKLFHDFAQSVWSEKAAIAQSVQRMATGWSTEGSEIECR
jgi:hypothetical protein